MERDELPRRAVALDDRLGVLVVDLRAAARSPPVGRRRAPRPPRGRGAARARPRPGGRRRGPRRASCRSRRASRRARRPARGSAGTRRERSRRRRPARTAARGSARRSARRGRARRAARIGSTWRPSSVPSAIAARNISPVETCGIPWSAESRCACVPLPEPCGPSTRRFTAGSPRSCASSSATPSGASCRARRRPRSAPTCRRGRPRRPARSPRSG